MTNNIVNNLLDRLERLVRKNENLELQNEELKRIYISRDTIHEMMNAMASGRKIDAIKYHRQLTGYGLKESKDTIEMIMNRMRPEVNS